MNTKEIEIQKLTADLEHIEDLYQEGKLKELVPLAEEILTEAAEKKAWGILGKTLIRLTATFSRLWQIGKAPQWIEYAEQSMVSLSATDVHRAYLSVAHAYIKKIEGDTDAIIHYYHEALDLLEASPHSTHLYLLSESLTQLGIFYIEQSNEQKGLLYLQKSLALSFPDEGKQNLYKYLAYSALARYHALQESFDKAAAYQKKSLHFFLTHYPPDHLNVLLAYIRTGAIHMLKASYTRAKETYREVIGYFEYVLKNKNEKTPLPYIASTYQNLGYTYLEQDMYHKALYYLERALETHRTNYGEKHPYVAIVLNNIGSTYLALKDFEKAKQIFQNALHCLYPSAVELKHDYWLQPPLKGSTQVSQSLKALKGKADAFYSSFLEQPTDNTKELVFAVQTYGVALQLFDNVCRSHELTESKFMLSRKIGYIGLCEGGILSTLQADEVGCNIEEKTGTEWAFDFCEQSKATVLMNAMQDSWAKANSHLPDDLLQKEKSLQIKLTELDKKIQKLQLKAEKTELEGEEKLQLHRWQAHFFDAHQTYTLLKKQLENSYPEYYQMKHDAQMVAVSELQSILEEHQILLNYFVGKSEIFIFVVTADDFVVMREDKPDDFEGLVTQFLQAIQHHEFDKYTQIAAQLYLLLLKSVEDYFIDFMDFEDYESVLKHLLIVPDGILCYLPFEALLRTEATLSFQPSIEESSPSSASKPSYTGLDYLLNHVAVSYHYSASLFYVLHQRKSSQNPKADLGSFAGFAPVYQAPSVPAQTAKDTISENPTAAPSLLPPPSVQNSVAWANRSEAIRSDGSFVPLPFSETEVKNIAELFAAKGLNTQTFLHEAATKEAFETVSNRYRFLLVAAHGLVNDEKTVLSGLVFYTSPLSPPEEERLGVGSERVDDGRQTVSGGQEKEEVGGKRQEVIYEKRDVGSEKREGVIYEKRDVGSEKREGVIYEKRDVGSEKREGVEKSPISNSPFEGSKEDVKGDIENKTNYQSLITNHQTDCILSMEETYQLDLRGTDLVVLSSCDSGIGRLVKGEGMMALNRGFLYAGASNVISTLFKVYDQPSSLLTQYLFEAILEGESYTFALRTAKMRLLQHKEASVKSWCGFVLFGK